MYNARGVKNKPDNTRGGKGLHNGRRPFIHMNDSFSAVAFHPPPLILPAAATCTHAARERAENEWQPHAGMLRRHAAKSQLYATFGDESSRKRRARIFHTLMWLLQRLGKVFSQKRVFPELPVFLFHVFIFSNAVLSRHHASIKLLRETQKVQRGALFLSAGFIWA